MRYDSAYVSIPYPGGDVPADTGVCTDEIIRIYRVLRIDLQKEVHEDMVNNLSAYPHKWKWLTTHTDTNIDHRRVPNLMVFFSRHGESLPVSLRADDYAPGDLVTWELSNGAPHIGILVDTKSALTATLLFTTLGRGRRWKMCCSTGKLLDTIATSALTLSYFRGIPLSYFSATA